MNKQIYPLLLGLTLLAACDPKKEDTPAVALPDVFILSEGQFNAGDGAVSGFNRGAKTVTAADAFGSANNGAKLGDVVQDMGVRGNRGYIVVNASGKIEVVSLPDFKSISTITGLEQPRYFTSTSPTRGYVTEWRGPFTGYLPGVLSIIDLTTNKVTSSVPVGRNPEQLLALGGKIYVPNSLDDNISVIDEATGTVSSTITVTDGPTGLVADKDNNVWVLCKGSVSYSTGEAVQVSPGTLIRFSPSSPTTQLKLEFPSTSGPSQLRINPAKDQLYYSFGGAEYQMSVAATTLPTTPFIRRNFSGFAIDPRDNTVFGAITPSYSANGRFVRYQATGAVIDSFEVKVGPNGFVFY
jgi:YVTN family beta-propeller protein